MGADYRDLRQQRRLRPAISGVAASPDGGRIVSENGIASRATNAPDPECVAVGVAHLFVHDESRRLALHRASADPGG